MRILKRLRYALKNIVREINYFDEFGEEFDLVRPGVGWKMRKATRECLAEMARVVVEGSFFDGVVFLWAMEQVRSRSSPSNSILNSWQTCRRCPLMRGAT